MTVKAILRDKGDDIIAAAPGDTICDVAKVLGEKRIGALLVLDRERGGDPIAGIVSERDIVRAIAQEGAGVLDKPVTHIMTRHVKRCSPADTVERVMEMMTEGRFRHLPVVEDGRLCGFISIGDVVRRRIGEVEAEARDVREYVRMGM